MNKAAPAPAMPAAASAVRFNPARLRSWLIRLPFTTRLLTIAISASCIAGVIFRGLPQLVGLDPSKVSLFALHRLTTYPFVYSGIFHCLVTLLALVPFLERFETEHGSLVTIALFCGPFSQIPAVLYILIIHVLLRGDNILLGAGPWFFLLLACESIKTYRLTPSFVLGPYSIPTYIYPFVFLVIAILLSPAPFITLVANLCGCLVGYAFEYGYLKILVPPEWGLRLVESKLNLLGRLPHYVSIDQKTFGRYGVLPSANLDPQSPNVGSSVRGLSPRAFAAATGPTRPT